MEYLERCNIYKELINNKIMSSFFVLKFLDKKKTSKYNFRGFVYINNFYLFENCGLLLAFLRPYFLRSTTRLSRVRRP